MATVNRPPFWVPRPSDDPCWSRPLPVNSPIIAFLTKQKIFGAGGQVPTKCWLPYLTYDDPPMWQGSPLNSQAITVTRTQVKFFGQAGQAPTKKWVPYLLYDDPPMWPGVPLSSGAIVATRTQVKVFGQPGQAPVFRPNFTYDDAPTWQWPLYERNRNVLFVLTMPFSNRQWQWQWYDDASGWSGEPVNSAIIQNLTQQQVFGQGGLVPPFRPNWGYDDPGFWAGEPVNSAVIQISTAQKFYGQGGQVPPFRPNFTYDDASYWSGEPINSAPLQLLTPQKIFGQGGQVPPYRWNYILDDAPSWQPWIQRNIGLLSVAPSPFSNRQWQWSDDAAGWQGAPLGSAVISPLTAFILYVPAPAPWMDEDDAPPWRQAPQRNLSLLTPTTAPFNNYKLYWYSEDSGWQGSPVRSAAIPLLTQQKVFGQGGQVAPFRWNATYDDPPPWQWPLYERNPNVLVPSAEPFNSYKTYWYSEDSFWQGQPRSSGAITVTRTQVTVFGQPGQAPPFRANFTYDDASPWQWPLYERNANVLQPSGQPFSNRQWQWSDDAASWQGTPLSSVTITLTSFSLYKPGVAFPAPPDDHSVWPAEPLARNLQLLQTAAPFSNRQAFWYSEDAWWNAKPVRSAAITLLTQQQVFGQGGQVVPFRWNYTIDDPPMWPGPVPRSSGTMQLPATGRVLNLYAPFNWTYTFDSPPMWQGAPASFNYLLTQPNPPAKPSGNDWIDFRRRARRR